MWADFAKTCAAVSELIITYIAQRVVAIICRLSHIPRLYANNTGTLRSNIRIVSPSQVELLPPATPQAPRMTWQTPDVTVVCQHPAQRKQRRSKRRARQKRNDKDSQEKFYTCQHQSISQHDVKKTSPKITDEAFRGVAAAPYRPPWLRQCG